MQNSAASLLIASQSKILNRCFREAVESFGVVVLERVQAFQDVRLCRNILPNTDQRLKHFLQKR
jgi:hypothetical protein